MSITLRPFTDGTVRIDEMSLSPRPLGEAVGRISKKTPIGSVLRTAEWERMPMALRERGFFSAGVESIRFLSDAQHGVRDVLSFARESTRGGEALIDRSSLIAKLRDVAKREGIPVDPKKAGGLQDITSRARLALIIDTQLAQAREYARWKAEQDPDVLEAFPAQELIRIEDRAIPRKWRERWLQAGGKLYGGRMIAAKNDPVWAKISRFGTPWPPYDFNSGMGIEDISRDEAEALGVMARGQIVPPGEEEFNAGLQASVRGVEPTLLAGLKNLFGDQIRQTGDAVEWRGNVIADFVGQALSDKSYKGEISIGAATPETVDAASSITDLTGYELQLTADEARHAIKRHGEGNEKRSDQAGLTPQDFAALPDLWRSPDSVARGSAGTSPALIFKKEFAGTLTMVTWRLNEKKKQIYLHTLWKKKGEGAA